MSGTKAGSNSGEQGREPSPSQSRAQKKPAHAGAGKVLITEA